MQEPTGRELTGIITATLTPFVSDTGAVDEQWIPAHLRFLEAQGVAGVLTLGTTGEGPSMNMDERRRVIDITLAHRGTMTVMAGTGCATLDETIALSRYALEQGVDTVLIMPPFYFKNVPDSGVLRYFEAIFTALPDDARVLLYHIPQVTAVPISHAVITELRAQYPRQCYGIKDSSGDAAFLRALVQQHPDLQVFCGNETQFANAAALGVAGFISAAANTFPALVRAVLDAPQAGDERATAQQRLSAVMQQIGGNTPPGLKAALPWTSGLPLTSVRVPLVNLSTDKTVALQQGLEHLGIALPYAASSL